MSLLNESGKVTKRSQANVWSQGTLSAFYYKQFGGAMV